MDTTAIPILRTARLTLRALAEADHADLYALAHDEAVSRFMHEGDPPSRADIAARVAGARRYWSLRGYGMMGLEDAEGFVGRLGLVHPPGGADPLLVYAVCRRGWGRGYATEGGRAFLRWLRTTHGTMPVLAQIDPRNDGSARVAVKLGGVRTGTASRAGHTLDVWTIGA
ncbi:GNAT family N-acetyltransferase [Methylobacterium nonmethylotrophicum]|uniref:N-acetyltransferase n=1 Tax=Methylobacterium nonmethylotrophicum TaxID=1141884 RepID=A0A4Z0NFM6_9HYPH|nr:GNAT family N-acetyltransferase [Methylobacterium nonmethylotrophicum]TGD94985.1 N-acetyltransferase [Methylobacterium nonmethylotrophicum]